MEIEWKFKKCVRNDPAYTEWALISCEFVLSYARVLSMFRSAKKKEKFAQKVFRFTKEVAIALLNSNSSRMFNQLGKFNTRDFNLSIYAFRELVFSDKEIPRSDYV